MELDFAELVTMLLMIIGIVILLGVVGAVGAYFGAIKYRNRDREERSLNFVLLSVAVPRDNEVKIDATEQMFSALSALSVPEGLLSFLKPKDHISFEIVALPGDIRFYVSTPKTYKDLLVKQIYAAYPGTMVEVVDEYNIFSEDGEVAYGALKLSKANYFPIKTYKELVTDPLSSLTSPLASLQEGEGACIQILVSGADSKWRDTAKAFVSKQKSVSDDGKGPKSSGDPRQIEAVESKMSKLGLEAVIRIVTSSQSKEGAKVHFDNIKNAFSQFSSDFNKFSSVKVKNKRSFMEDFIYRYMPIRGGGGSVLNIEELASIFHFPNRSVETPNIYWLNFKRAPTSSNMATEGLLLGKSVFRDTERPVYLSDDDRRRHVYIIGRTGTGKTELLKSMILQDIRAGKGVCFIDPHGDAAEDLLAKIPKERADDVIYFDPSDQTMPMGLNIMEVDSEEQKGMVISSFIGLLYKIHDPHKQGIVGPRLEHAVRNTMLTVMSIPGSTLLETYRAVTDLNYVKEILPRVTDPVVRRYWTDEIANTNEYHRSETLGYFASKFGPFVTDRMIRNIIGQSKSAFNIREVMDQQKILIINLSKGKLTAENSQFLGLLLVPKILTAAMSRQDMPESERKDFYFYVDEFQNFATNTFAEILSEARKYRLNLIVANQFVNQMPEEVKDAVFGNVGTLISFRVGVEDANTLSHEFKGVFNEADLTNIARFQTYVRTIFHNEPLEPFSMDTTRDLTKEFKSLELAAKIKELSRQKFGRNVDELEPEIIQRAKLG